MGGSQVTKDVAVPSAIIVDVSTKKSIHVSDTEGGPAFLNMVAARIRAIKDAFEGVSDCLIFLDMSGRILDLNKKAAQVFGRSRKELFGRHLRTGQAAVGRTAKQATNFVQILAGRKGIVSIHTQNRRGREFILECSGSIIKMGREPIAIMVIGRDITESKKAEERIKESEEKFRTLAEESPNMIFVYAKGRVVYANKKCEELMGYRKDEFYASAFDFLTLIAPEHRDIVRHAFATHSEGKEYHPYEYALLTRDGRRIDAIITTKLITYEGTLAILGIVVDITDRKKMETELRRYAEALEDLVEERTRKLKEAERLAAIGELATMVGHDLRNPLASMEYTSYNLRTNYAPNLDKDGLRMLEMLEEDIDRSNKIINDLLDYSAKIRLDPEITDINSILKQTCRSLKIPENIKLVDLTKQEPKIEVDFAKIQRVFINMVKNAIDAMSNGGTLTIKSKETNGSADVTISDTGTGLSEETIKKLWTPLFTTKAKGMGFGLAISKRLIEAHGGSVSVKSELGKGTTFTIIIPIKQQKDSPKP